MTGKIEIVERLGENAVLLPQLLGAALAANDRIKLHLSVLQEALAQAQHPLPGPRASAPSSAGIDEAALAALIAGGRMVGSEHVYLPGVGALLASMKDDLAAMLAPLEASDAEASRVFHARLDLLGKQLASGDSDQIERRMIGELASSDRCKGDSVHLLVMDMHKALIRLTAETAVEDLDGAQVHSLTERDRGEVSLGRRDIVTELPEAELAEIARWQQAPTAGKALA